MELNAATCDRLILEKQSENSTVIPGRNGNMLCINIVPMTYKIQ